MEQMKAGILSVCMLGTAVGIISLLRPGQTLERQIRFLLSLLLVIGITVPLLQIRLPDAAFSGNAYAAQQAENQEAFDRQLLQETEQQVEAALQERLAAAGIFCTELTAVLHREENGCIYCSEVQAVCSDPEAACAVLRDALGEEVVIHAAELAP